MSLFSLNYTTKKVLLLLAQVLLAGLVIGFLGLVIALLFGFVRGHDEDGRLMIVAAVMAAFFFGGCFFGANQDYRELDY